MQIRLTFEEVYQILTETLKRQTGKDTVVTQRFVVEENEGAKLIERPMQDQFSAVYFELK